jgi:hypothetical protein
MIAQPALIHLAQERFFAASRPLHSEPDAFRLDTRRGAGVRTVIQAEHYIGAHPELPFDALFGSENLLCAPLGAAEHETSTGYTAQSRVLRKKRKDLKSPGIGSHGAMPAHERVDASH